MSFNNEVFDEKTNSYNLRKHKSAMSEAMYNPSASNTLSDQTERKESKATMEKKLDTIMKKLENLQSVPRQLTELSERLSVMESEVKTLACSF